MNQRDQQAATGGTTPPSPLQTVRLEQTISQYHPDFDVKDARLGLGLDGLVYLTYARTNPLGHVIRVDPDGGNRYDGIIGDAVTAIAASANGTIATGEAVFKGRVALWDKSFNFLGQNMGFLNSDAEGFQAPSDVQAGPSGDFYAIDQYRLRVRRINPAGGLVDEYKLDRLGVTAGRNLAVGLRVDEARQRLVTAWGTKVIRASTFAGEPLWSVPALPAGTYRGTFDLAPDGSLYVLESGNQVRVFDTDGIEQPGRAVLLKGSDLTVSYLRVHGQTLIVKRVDKFTLFEKYDRVSGERICAVPAEVERLTAEYPSPPWFAGKPIPLTVGYDSGQLTADPNFRVWLRPLGVPEFTELPVTDATVTPPADARGLYHLRVSPDARGNVTDYVLDGVVEIRTPGANGTVSIMALGTLTDTDPIVEPSRFYFGKAEPIPVKVIARTGSETPPSEVTVLMRRNGEVVHSFPVALTNGTGVTTLDGDFTAFLSVGRYILDAEVPGRNVAPHYLELGSGIENRPDFHITQYGDYKDSLPVNRRITRTIEPPVFADLPDSIDAHLTRVLKLGFNLFVDRLGKGGFQARFQAIAADAATVLRLRSDPVAVAEQKLYFEDATWRTIAGYGAYGIEEQAILLFMDAHLPLGEVLNPKPISYWADDLEAVTKKLRQYPAFRGWSWAANWWIWKLGAEAAKDEAEKTAYLDAIRAANDTGAWSAVLDTVSDRILALKTDAESLFATRLDATAPGKVSAVTGPYRAIGSHPPVIFQNADEVDLQFQSEQIPPPLIAAHQVDFYRRPGKPAWGHPELRNDDGTGAMFAATLFQMAMRRPDGVGAASPEGDAGAAHGGVDALSDPRGSGTGPRPGDVRSGGAGKTSMLRAAWETIGQFGSIMADCEPVDSIAIVVSARMQRIDEESGNGVFGIYFSALFEAYNSCLYAHRPASIVFTEDLTEDTLGGYRAVLVANQRVELDPPLAAALDAADAAGVKVYYDGTCRAELMPGYAVPLDVGFDRVRTDPSVPQDDAVSARFREYFIGHAGTLREALNDVVPPVAACDNSEVLLTEHRYGDVRYIWAVNNTVLDWDPGLMWRVSMFASHRVPVMVELTVTVPPGHHVFDVFAGQPAPMLGGKVTADLRTMPARLYAILPAPQEPLAHRPPVQQRFGPHVRDIAVSADGQTGVLSCFNWDHNLYGLDLLTGQTRWRDKIGHFFAFGPTAHSGGTAVQGFDVDSAEGYHLYLVKPSGDVERRFALFGLPKRATDWSTPEWGYDTGINNFAVSPDGSWVASCGDLGLVVWDRGGTELWSDEWWADRRDPLRLLAIDDSTVITYTGGDVTARDAADGSRRWSLRLSETGTLQGAAVSADRETVVFWSTTLSGRLFVVRDAAVVNTIAAGPVDEVSLSADGSRIASTLDRLLRVYDAEGGLLWTYTGDDLLRRPRVSPDGERIAVGSELGTLTVLDRDGNILAEKDMLALPVSAWLPGGDLLAATWTGDVTRFDTNIDPIWTHKLTPTETDAASKLRAPDHNPSTRKTGWGNATDIPLALTPNLLAEPGALINPLVTVKDVPYPYLWRNPLALLHDGKPDAPPQPWLQWHEIGRIDSPVYKKLVVDIDAFRTLLHVEGVTFAEDPAHPQSWLRDVRLRYWDIKAQAWRDGPMLLSDAAIHSHKLAAPIEARRFQLVTTGGGAWPAGNLRLGELVFHGRDAGSSHPDVMAKKPTAVLFGQREGLETLLYSPIVDYQYSDPNPGDLCLELSEPGQVHPGSPVPFTHTIPDWDFEIAENPTAPGQYRHLQFAWRAISSGTTGIRVRFGLGNPGRAVDIVVGEDAGFGHPAPIAEHRITGRPSTTWSTVRVDLWALTNGQPPRIQTFAVRATGGGARFGKIALGRTPADLP